MAEQYVAKISEKGQITIPKKLREKYGLKGSKRTIPGSLSKSWS